MLQNLFINRTIYIAPYNDLSLKAKYILDKKIRDYFFGGYIDKNKSNIENIEKESFIIIVSPNYFLDIYSELDKKYIKDNVIFVFGAIIFNRLFIIKNIDVYMKINILLVKFLKIKNLYKKSISKLNQARRRWKTILMKYFNEKRSFLFRNSYFLPLWILKYQAKRENRQVKYNLFENSRPDFWLRQNKNMHNGKRCFILATGPSLNQIDLSKIKDEYTIGVNGIYKLAESIDLDYFIYVSDWYWKHHVEGIKNLQCKRRFLPAELVEYLDSNTPTSWINVLRSQYYTKLGYPQKVPFDFSLTPEEFFYAGGTVIFLALQLAYHLGFKEVIVLGLDHTYREEDYKNIKHSGYYYDTHNGDNAHFDPEYNPQGIKVHVDLDAMERGYAIAKEYFERDGRKIFNASPATKLEIFEKVDYDSLF